MNWETDGSRLLDYLRQEFGAAPADFLSTARELLDGSFEKLPRLGNLIVYSLRECLDRILSSATVPGGGEFKILSRSVVSAKKNFEEQSALAGGLDRDTLEVLLERIDDLERFHDESDDKHTRRLAAVVLNRNGVRIDGAQTASRLVRRSATVTADLNKAVHVDRSVDEARTHFEDAVSVLEALFAPHDLRFPKIEEFAAIGDPTPEDAERLLDLMASGRHLTYFFEHAGSPAWLNAIDEVDPMILAPPKGRAEWPVEKFADRLGQSHGTEIAGWLRRRMKNWKDGAQPWFVAKVAAALGDDGFDIVHKLVSKYATDLSVAFIGVNVLKELPPEHPRVEQLARPLTRPGSGLFEHGFIDWILEPLINGATLDNLVTRLGIIGERLREIEPEDDVRRIVLAERAGSIADEIDVYDSSPFAILLHGYVEMLRRAIEIEVPTGILLEKVDDQFDDIGPRLRSWVLGNVVDIRSEDLVEEIASAIDTREACGDDVAVVDRVMAELVGNQDVYLDRWKAAFGQPPTTEAVGELLADHELPESVFHKRGWAGLVPEACSASWHTVLTMLSAVYGPSDRERFTNRAHLGLGVGQSPMTVEELKALSINDAMQRVRDWRPEPNDYLVGAVELARTLQAVVADDPAKWTALPVVEIISGLRHPTYISHFFMALSGKASEVAAFGESVVEAVAVCRTHPWPVTELGDRRDYDTTWDLVDIAGVDLIGKLADAEAHFGERTEQAWHIAEEAARNRSQASAISGRDDPLHQSLNRSCTRALASVFSLLGNEFRATGSTRESGLALIDEVLRLDADDGAQYRAVVVTRLRFLQRIAPDWVDERVGLLFGDDAPTGLADASVELVIRSGNPDPWFLERTRDRVLGAFSREVERSGHVIALGALWEVSGYTPDGLVNRVRSIDLGLLSTMGEAFARLLRADDAIEPKHVNIGVEFWEQVLKTEKAEALTGFGWWSEVRKLDQARWESLTLRTAALTRGRLDWAHHVAERVAEGPVTEHGCAILDHLVRGLSNDDDWDRIRVVEVSLRAVASAPAEVIETDAFARLKTALIERLSRLVTWSGFVREAAIQSECEETMDRSKDSNRSQS